MNSTPLNKSSPIIEAENLTVVFGKNVILNNINFKIYKGDYIGLIGRNGSGKSTLMKTILGLIKPTNGSIRIFGEPVKGDMYEKIGYVPQMHQIAHEFPATVGDVVKMGLYHKLGLHHLNSKADFEKVMLALHKVKMEEFVNRPVGHLSGGEQQKVLVAQAIVREPQILLMDEPTSALDFVMIQDFLRLLTELNKNYGITLIVIQHNLEILRPFCSRLFMLRRSIMYDGNPNSSQADEMIKRVFRD